MAKLFPALDPAEIKNQGERTVARALVDHLPSRVEVFHGFNWLSRTRAGTIMEGECDFVLLDAEHGLLFVEVKGGDPGRGRGADAGVRAAWGLSTSSMPSWSTRDRTFTNCSGEAPSSTVTANS